MKAFLELLYQRKPLSKSQAKEVLINISNDVYSTAQVASFITVYLMREIQVEELKGFKEALLELAMPFDLQGQEAIDLCGTGGDGKNTFNISTLASFVVAGAGYKVVKHGNYGVSSISGSSNVLEELGHSFTNNTDILLTQLDQSNICFCHAPLFHPALKGVGPIRKSLGVKTFFNMLGPLVNPAQPSHQLVGVFNLRLAKLYKYIFQSSDQKYRIIHALDGYDEVSLTGDCHIISNSGESVKNTHYFGSNTLAPDLIQGGTSIHDSAKIFLEILQNNGTAAQEKVVTANAALAIQCFDSSKSIDECLDEAKESISSGKALNAFQKLIQLS